MPTAVVCDDDRGLRGAVSRLCHDLGIDVIAETDSGGDALEVVQRFGADIVVVDVALNDGSGERVVEALRTDPAAPRVIVFTTYAADAPHLRALGAVEVVPKPDMGALRRALEEVNIIFLDQPPERSYGERRATSRPVVPPPELWRSPSGIASPHDIINVAQHVTVGDSVLVVALTFTEPFRPDVTDLLRADCRLATGRLLRQTLRTDDLVHELPEIDGYVAILRGGDDRSPEAVWDRLVKQVDELGLGELRGAWRPVDELGVTPAIDLSIAALTQATADQPRLLRA